MSESVNEDDTTQHAAIEADGLCKYYDAFQAIEQVSFTVPAGCICAFLGPNGAGKSTTIKILTGVLAPSRGEARIAGMDVFDKRMETSRILGYLGENGPLYPEMTPERYLRYVAQVRGIVGDAANTALKTVLEDCQLGEVWHRPIRKLSKGFRQRVGLAQAIIHDPQVLILDEPTTGLDPNQISVVRDLITDFAKKERKAVLLSTHILQEVRAIADKVILVNQGKVRFDGTPDELAGDKGLEARFKELTKGVAA